MVDGLSDKNFLRQRAFLKRVGALLCVMSAILIVYGAAQLLNSGGSPGAEKLPSHALSARLFCMLVPVPDLFAGLVLVFCPKPLHYRLYLGLQKWQENQRVSMSTFDKSFNAK